MSLTVQQAELVVHDRSIRSATGELVAQLREILGAQLVAYIAGVNETRTVREWADGTRNPHRSTEQRLRMAYRASALLAREESHTVVQTWFQGLNPLLEDRSPARVLRDGELDEVGASVLAAARTFVEAA